MMLHDARAETRKHAPRITPESTPLHLIAMRSWRRHLLNMKAADLRYRRFRCSSHASRITAILYNAHDELAAR
jgi:hypothetical protein